MTPRERLRSQKMKKRKETTLTHILSEETRVWSGAQRHVHGRVDGLHHRHALRVFRIGRRRKQSPLSDAGAARGNNQTSHQHKTLLFSTMLFKVSIQDSLGILVDDGKSMGLFHFWAEGATLSSSQRPSTLASFFCMTSLCAGTPWTIAE